MKRFEKTIWFFSNNGLLWRDVNCKRSNTKTRPTTLWRNNYDCSVVWKDNRGVTKGGGQEGRNFPGTKSLWARQKVPTMSQVLSSTVHLLPKDLMFEHSGAKLVSRSGRHPTSLRPWQQKDRVLYRLRATRNSDGDNQGLPEKKLAGCNYASRGTFQKCCVPWLRWQHDDHQPTFLT